MKEQLFKGKQRTSVFIYLTRLKSAREIHEGAAISLTGNFISGPVSAGIRECLKLSANGTNGREGTTTSFANVRSYPSRWFNTAALIAKDDGELRNFKQGLLLPCAASQMERNLTLACRLWRTNEQYEDFLRTVLTTATSLLCQMVEKQS